MGLSDALDVLNTHHIHFFAGQRYASITAQPAPEDSRAWSQILISTLTGIRGMARHKGQDLADGSDVKSANAWYSIDKVRFNGVIKAGTQSHLAGSMDYLDQMPFLFSLCGTIIQIMIENELVCGSCVRSMMHYLEQWLGTGILNLLPGQFEAITSNCIHQ